MTTPPDLIDPFHRALRGRLEEQYTNRADALVKGSAAMITEDVQTVAEKYAAQVSYLKALLDIMDVCEEVERDRYGARPAASRDE